MGNGLLGEESYLLEASDYKQNLLTVLEVEGGAPKGTLVKIAKGNLVDSVTHGICAECRDETGNHKSKYNCA